eukprot:SAG31_NODE_406_length_16063_cov_22.636056_5_plen_157_part_00
MSIAGPSTDKIVCMGGQGSPALSYHQAYRILKLAAAKTVPAWREFDYGGHSLHIGRVNDMLAAQNSAGDRLADEEQINSWSMHTASAGRASYDRSAIAKDYVSSNVILPRYIKFRSTGFVFEVAQVPRWWGRAQLVKTGRLCKCHTPIESSEDGLD